MSRPILEPPGDTDVRPKPFVPTYVARRRLSSGELGAAAGIAAGVAAAAFYLATLWLERTPLRPEDEEPTTGRRPRR